MSKTVSGELITIDDSAYDGLDDIVIYGNTVQNLWVNPSGTGGGIAITPQDDGSVAVSGTVTGYCDIFVVSHVFKPNTTYAISVDNRLVGAESAGGVGFYVYNGTKTWYALSTSEESRSFTTTDDVSSMRVGFYINNNISAVAGATISGTYKVMLNEGSTAQPWCPPGLNGVDELSVVCAGKNLLARMGLSLPYTTAGITFSDNGDGGIRISGTATAAAYYNFFSKGPAKALRITPGEYTASSIGVDSGLNLSVGYFDGEIGGSSTSWLATNVPGVSNTGSVDRPVYLRPFLSVVKGKTVDTVVYPQLELGSTATAYEPPNITTTPIDLQGHTLNSLPDGTRDELHIDGGGNVVLEKRVGSVDSTNSFGAYGATPPCFGCSDAPYSIPGNGENMRANGLKVAIDGGTRQWPNYTAGSASNGGINRVYVKGAEDDATASDLKSTMEGVNALVLYPLAEPQTIDLGKIDLPKLRKKPLVNNVWANGSAETTSFYLNTEMELTYRQWPGVRADGFKVSGKHNFWDFASCIASSDSGKPEKKFVTATVPYMSGFYDLSKIYGAIAYESRDVSYTFEILGDDMDDLQRQKTNLLDWLGLVHDEPIYDDTQPNYHYVGSFYEADWEEDETGESGTLTVTFKCQPFLIADRATEESLSVGTHTVVNHGQQVSVFAKANSGSATVKINGVIQAVTTTEQRLTAQLQPGENEVVVTSNSVTLRYYERHL